MNELEILPTAGFFALIFLIAGKIFLLKKKGVKVSSGKNKTSSQVFLLYFVFLLMMGVWIFEIAQPVFQFNFLFLPLFFTQPLLKSLLWDILGAAFVIAGLILMATSLSHFKNSLRFGLDENNQGKLITSGIFSFSRNPFFLSLDLYFLGVALILSNLFFIIFAVLAIVGIHFFILKEEKFMRKYFGNKYLLYSRSVRRYF